MRKVIFLVGLLLISSAFACPTEDIFKFQIKKSLFNYLQNPEIAHLTIYEVKDLLEIYLTKDISIENCSTMIGIESGISISTILSKSEGIENHVIPRCSDGTLYGECSITKPKFCYSGLLKSMCYGPDMIPSTGDDCTCPDYEICDTDGSCRVVGINCYSDSDCGTSTFVGGNYCQDNNVYRDYINFTCIEAGLSTSHCTYENQNNLVTVCTGGCKDGSCI